MLSKLIIAGAFEPEVEPVGKLIGTNSQVQIVSIGVGLLEAVMGIGEVLREECETSDQHNQPSTGVIFIGSCGTHDTSVPLMSVVIASASALADYSNLTAAESSFIPQPSKTLYPTGLDLTPRSNLPTDAFFEPIYSTLAISRDLALARSISKTSNSRFENLELFAVAVACARYNTPFAALSVVTNYTTPEGHADWEKNYRAAAQRSAELVGRVVLDLVGE